MNSKTIVTKYLAHVGGLTCQVEGRGPTPEAAYHAAVGELRLQFGRFLSTGGFRLVPIRSSVQFGR